MCFMTCIQVLTPNKFVNGNTSCACEVRATNVCRLRNLTKDVIPKVEAFLGIYRQTDIVLGVCRSNTLKAEARLRQDQGTNR